MSWSTITLEVFIRREFGERYLSIGRVILGILTLRFFLGIANFRSTFSWIPGISPLASERSINRFFVICFMLLSLLHLLRIIQRNNKGITYHSRSFGVSFLNFLTKLPPVQIGELQFSITDFVLYRFIEPGLCLCVAWFLIPGPSFTQRWILWSSVAMFFHNNMQYSGRRGRYLDIIDSQIESDYYISMQEEATQPQTKQQTAGYAVMAEPSVAHLKTMQQTDIQATVRETIGTVAQ